MEDTLILEKLGHRVKRVFKVRVPELGDTGCYRASQHMEGFRKRELLRAFGTPAIIRNCNEKLWYLSHRTGEFESVQAAFENSYDKALPAPADGQMLVYNKIHDVIHLEGMPAFFAFIGYDYAKNKYLPESAVAKHKQDLENGVYS